MIRPAFGDAMTRALNRGNIIGANVLVARRWPFRSSILHRVSFRQKSEPLSLRPRKSRVQKLRSQARRSFV